MSALPQPGSVVEIRSARWKVLSTDNPKGYHQVNCRGLSGIVRDKDAHFIWQLENRPKILDPATVQLVPDESPGFIDTKLHLEAAFRRTPTTTRKPLTLGKAAVDDLKFQHVPVEMALSQERVRLLIADDVGLGKTFEVGLVTAELVLRGRAERILVVTTRAMLNQFQKDFWTRFSIPLSRLDSAAIRRIRNRIPAHYNVFDQFDRAIISIDTLKRDAQIRDAIKNSYWDLIIIDEAHNAATRSSTTGTNSQRAKLAKLLARRTDSLLLLTATPHDGSQASFASLIEMLDPTRVPDIENLRRKDIKDLVVRRFRSSEGVADALDEVVPERRLVRRDFTLSPEEEIVYQSIADLKLDLDKERPRARAIDLFRTTLAKAIFSSPVACFETLDGRIKRIENNTARGTKGDLARLKTLAEQVSKIDTSAFSKYQNLLCLLKDEIRWTGKKPRDRLVIFSERIATAEWLAGRFQKDVGLSESQIARIDGSGVEADERIQKALEDFGQKSSPLRVLIASDMASEGLNLHHQCHRLIHFDLPWSLLRFQQRNGRIDRYGQDRSPEITYFVAKSTHEKVRQMWVLDKLVEKDIAAQRGVGDPAVFLGVGDAAAEESEVAEAVMSCEGPEAFESQMDERVADAGAKKNTDSQYQALFGEYINPEGGGQAYSKADVSTGLSESKPPRLFYDTFDYATEIVQRLSDSTRRDRVFSDHPDIDKDNRLIRIRIPNDMRTRDGLGFSRKGDVDRRYMPSEAVGLGDVIELTDNPKIVSKAVADAKIQDNAWPTVQFLWDCHPILEWFSDRASGFFDGHSAPVASLSGVLGAGEIAVILHGAIPNERGAPVVDRWAVILGTDDGPLLIEELDDFLRRTCLHKNIPNRAPTDMEGIKKLIPRAVNEFQFHLVKLRRIHETAIEADLDSVLDRLSDLELRFKNQIGAEYADAPKNEASHTLSERRLLARKKAKEQRIEEIFKDWAEWFERTRRMSDDPNPHVDVLAVFWG